MRSGIIVGGRSAGPRFPAENSGLRLLYASLVAASRSWRGVKMTPDIWWELEVLRRGALGESSKTLENELAAAYNEEPKGVLTPGFLHGGRNITQLL